MVSRLLFIGWTGLAWLGCAGTTSDKPTFLDDSEPNTDSDAPAEDSAEDTGEPCECDDGLFCNGVESCDDEGACEPGAAPEPEDDGDPCTVAGDCDEATDGFDHHVDTSLPACAPYARPPEVGPQDYAAWYWPQNHRPTETWPAVLSTSHFLTGHYAFAFDETTAQIPHLGALTDRLSAEAAQQRPLADIEALPAAKLHFEVGPAEAPVRATTFLGADSTTIDRTRMVDGGRFLNRLVVPTVRYADDDALAGTVQIASMPRHFVLSQTISNLTGPTTARVRLGGDVLAGLDTATWLIDDHALTLTDASGAGWLFVIFDTPDTTSRLVFDAAGEVLAERDGAADTLTVSLLVAPLSALAEADLAVYLDPTKVQVHSTLLDVDGSDVGESVPAEWDPTLGAYRITAGSLQEAGAPRRADFDDPAFHNWYGRHRVTLDVGDAGPVSVPLTIHGDANLSWYITGGSAFWRDEDGAPLGLPLQISKNWHGEYWYHLTSQPTVSGSTSLELTMASSRWGHPYAASHAQLSLIGWGTAGGHWDESALGAFGENITYDPDLALGRAMVDDVRPVLVDAGTKWSWTGNVGGADFLRYTTAAEPYWQRRLGRVRSHYRAHGPNLTDVVYSGVSSDQRIQADIRVQLGATDDLVRVHYILDYTFVEDVAYDRLAFFQVAADNYGDNGFAGYAWGNADTVAMVGAVPDHRTTGYASDADRGIPLDGTAPWVMLYDNQRDWDSLPEHYADIGFVVRHFEANIGGTVVTTPHINLNRTYNGGASQLALELGLPHEDGSPWCGAACEGQTRFIPAGSRVRATVEYLVPPADKSRYYGESAWLLDLPDAAWRSPEMMRILARDNDVAVEVSVGTLVRPLPIEVQAAEGAVAADLRRTGGLGYTPLTVHGLPRHDGWTLQVEGEAGWEAVDVSVVDNDGWQAVQDPDAGTWSLTWSVAAGVGEHLRVVWED